jgi:hypothetical protein
MQNNRLSPASVSIGKLIGSVFIAIGFLIMIAGVIWLLNTAHFVSKAAVTRAKILDLEQSRRKGGTLFYPVFRFADAGGILHTQRSAFASSDYPFEVGELVPVLYDPQIPRRAKIKTFKTLWLGPVFITAYGLLFGGGSAVWLIAWLNTTNAAAHFDS